MTKDVDESTTNQDELDISDHGMKGQVNNPDGKGGFADNPDNRSDGRWDKTKVFSYQYRRFMNMTIPELKEYALKPDEERTVVEDLAYERVRAAKISLPDVKEITDRTEGKPKQSIDHTSGGEPLEALVKFI